MMFETKNADNQTVDGPFWLLGKKILWKSMGTINWLISNIHQNIFFCVQQNKEIRTGLDQLWGLINNDRLFILAKRLMHMAHLSGNTSGVSKSSSDWLNYTGFPGDVCVAFFNVPARNKDAVAPNPLTKEESRRVYNCDDKRLSRSNKRWIFKSMWNI